MSWKPRKLTDDDLRNVRMLAKEYGTDLLLVGTVVEIVDELLEARAKLEASRMRVPESVKWWVYEEYGRIVICEVIGPPPNTDAGGPFNTAAEAAAYADELRGGTPS